MIISAAICLDESPQERNERTNGVHYIQSSSLVKKVNCHKWIHAKHVRQLDSSTMF